MRSSAQSLIETIVAVGIVAMGIVAILGVGASHLAMGGQSAERVIATNLAREGVEIIFAIRNSNWLDPSKSWPYGLSNNDYYVSYNTTDLTTVVADSSVVSSCDNCKLYITDDDVYTHTVTPHPTVYRRLISISNGNDLDDPLFGGPGIGIGNCSDNCEKKIISTVYWVERGRPHTLTTEARVTDWR